MLWIEKKIINYEINKFMEGFGMTGWKTWAGGIAGILTGLAIVISALSSGDYSHISEGVLAISGGLAVIGIGHKIEKAGL